MRPNFEVVHVAGDRDVERLPVVRDRHRVHALQAGAVQVERLAGARHVRDGDVERGPPALAAAEHRDDGRRRHVGGAHGQHLERGQAAQRVLGDAHGLADLRKALARVLGVGGQRGEHRADGVAGVAVVQAERHRDHGGERLLRQAVVLEEVAAQGARAHGQHEVVDRGAGGLGRGPDPAEAPALGGEAAGPGDVHVEHGGRGLERERRQLLVHGQAGRPQEAGGQRHQVEAAPHHLERGLHRGVDGVVGGAVLGLAAAGPVLPRRVDLGVGIGGQRPLEQPQGGHPVDHGVVHLGVDREAVALQALDQHQLPERALAVEQRAVHARAEGEQLADPAGLGQRRVADVVLEVELLVVAPRPLATGAQRPVGALAEQRRDVVVGEHALVLLAEPVGADALGQLEDLEAAHVHRRGPGLREQEGRIGG
nr:hypothetical protein [Aquihabitans sp. G128]